MRKLILLIALLGWTAVTAYSQQQSAAQDDHLAPVAPLLDAQTFAVARVDLVKIDAAAAVNFAATIVGEVPADEAKAAATKAQGFLATLREYGAQDLYVIVSLADVPENPPPFAFTLKAGANEDLIASHVKPLLPKPMEQSARMNKVLVFGSAGTIARLRDLKAVPRPDLAAALANAGGSPVQLVAAIPADVRRVVKELVGKLPAEIGGGQGEDMLDALQWSSLAIEPPPKLAAKWTIQSKNEAAAVGLRPRILAGLNLIGQQSKMNELLPDFADFAIRLTPAVKGDRLELNLSGADMEAVVKQVQAGPLKLARNAAGHAQSMNNLRQIALAMHNFHDVNGKFPAAASYSKDGKPLLSWRVHILPFIEQNQLYQQFHLDEPWDSEHNRKLISQMPKTYLDPTNPQLAKDNKTVYALPVGEKTPFGGKTGMSLAKIVDGTSNTIMVVELAPDRAVVWSQPDDWNFQAKEPAAGLIEGDRKRVLAAFCDGSVRTLPADIDLQDLRRLVQMNDGEPLSKQY